jgi:hypothetical protein
MARDETAIVQLQVRLREDLRAHLEESARTRSVSLNSEIVGRLEHTRDRSSLTMEVLALVFGNETASILVLLGAVMHEQGLLRAGTAWADDAAAYNGVLDGASEALEVLRSGKSPTDVMVWIQAAGMVDRLAGGQLSQRVEKTISRVRSSRPDKQRSRPK